MRPFFVSLVLALLASSSATAQKAVALDIGLTGGSVRDYYRFQYGPRWEQFQGLRADVQLARTGLGPVGVTAQFDTYRYNEVQNLTCPSCVNTVLSDVRRVSAGPFWRHPIGEALDVSGTVLGGWAKRMYQDANYHEDESSHLFYSAEVGVGVHLRGFRVGAQWESGFMQRVYKGTRDQCELADHADPFPGTTLDCRPVLGPRGFTRIGLAVSYRLTGVRH